MELKRIQRGLKRRTIDLAIGLHNAYARVFYPRKKIKFSELEFLRDIQLKSMDRNDICDHLTSLFSEAVAAEPKLIVELGVRGGESTFVLERVAKLTGCKLLSVDMNDCRDVSSYADWNFVKSDDITFANNFSSYCQERSWNPKIDCLFIDTSHEYQHTVQEIAAWFPFLAEHSTVVFHDTNMREIYSRKDRTWGHGWDNKRGVIKAIEEHFNRHWDENQDFTDIVGEWVISHVARCSGFTILRKTFKRQ